MSNPALKDFVSLGAVLTEKEKTLVPFLESMQDGIANALVYRTGDELKDTYPDIYYHVKMAQHQMEIIEALCEPYADLVDRYYE